MPAGTPYGRTALPTKTVDDAAYVGLAERMAQDYFRLGASHRADGDAESLAQIRLPDTGITGTTGYESMLESGYDAGGGGESGLVVGSNPTPAPYGEQGGPSAGAGGARAAFTAMPEAPALPQIQPRRVSEQPAQAFELPGTEPTAPISFTATPGAGPGGAATAPGAPAAMRATAAPAAPEALGPIEEGNPERYFATAGPYARQVERETGIPAALSLAISANETGYGQRRYMAGSNNFHGIQARAGEPGAVPYKDWRPGPGGQEFYDAAQRSFDSPLSGFRGFADFLTSNPRYQPALERYRQTGDVNELAAGIHRAGYAEDPQYTTKITSIMKGIPVSTGVGEVTDTRGVPLAGPAVATQRASEARGAAGERGGLDTAGITQTYAGKPYVFGGAGGRSDFTPGTATDCSGFVASVWRNQYGLPLAAHTDTSYNQLKALGATDVAEADARPGDVVYYMGAGTGGAITHHMGIYAGPGTVLDMSVSGGDGVKTRDIGHAGRHVILRDPRVNAEMPKQPLAPPPIVPSGDSGGQPISHADASALQLEALSFSPTSISGTDAGAAGGGELEQPYDPDQGPREALPGSVGAAPYLGPMSNQPELVTPPAAEPPAAPFYQPVLDAGSRAVSAVQSAYAVPEEDRPPQYSGPSYAQPAAVTPPPDAPRTFWQPTETEQAGMGPPVGPEWLPGGVRQAAGALSSAGQAAAAAEPASVSWLPQGSLAQQAVGSGLAAAAGPISAATDYLSARADPTGPSLVRSGILETDLTPEEYARHTELQNRRSPITRTPGQGPLTPEEDAEYLAVQDALEARYQAVKDDPDQYMAYYHAAKGSNVLPAYLGMAAAPVLGMGAGAAATRAAGVLGAGARTARAIGYGANIAAQTAVDPTTPFTQGPIDAVTAAVRAGRRVPGQVAAALGENAQRTAAADARMAAQGSTAAPGVFGLSGIEPENPLVQGMRPRIIPPHVADELDFPVRNPTDPTVLRAIEAAGGTVDERGTTLNVIRNQGPEAHGGTATRGMPFYIAGPKGTPNPYASAAGAQTGGPVRIEGETRFRSPLILSDAPGGSNGFNEAAEQLGIKMPAGRVLTLSGTDISVTPKPQTLTSQILDQEIVIARHATREGSPARASALKELVSKYGGDPDVIDDLLAVRGAGHSESAWAIKENIVAANARKQQYDGVVTVQPRAPGLDEINAHPAVKAAEAERFEINRRLGQIPQEVDARAATLPATTEAERLQDPQIAKLVDEYNQLYQRRDQMPQALEDAKTQAYKDLSSGRITELADPREARNPTPGSPTADMKAAYKRAKDAERAAVDARNQLAYHGVDTPEVHEAIRVAEDEAKAANDALDALMNEADTPTGYELRPDIPRRGDGPASTQVRNPRIAEAREAYGRALQAAAGKDPSSPEVAALGRAYDDFVASQRESPFLTAPPTRGPGSAIAQASAGALQGGARPDRLATVNRALSQGVVSSVSGGVGAQVNQELNPDDPYAGIKGFAAGALVPPLAARGGRALARAAGAAPAGAGTRALATAGGLPPVDPDEIADLARRAADTPVRGPRPESKQTVKNVAGEIKRQVDAGIPPEHPEAPMEPPNPPPNWWDHAENWRYNIGLFAQLATGAVQAVGGAVTMVGGGTAEALRLAVLRGQGEALPIIAGEGIKALPGAVGSSVRTVLGQVPKAIEAGSDYRPSLHAREFAQGNVGRGAAALAIGTPGRTVTQAPDAFWHELFYRSGIAQAAADVARSEFGGGASVRGLAGGVAGGAGGYESTPEGASPWETLARTAGGAILGGGVASVGPTSLRRAQRTRELIANPTPEILEQAAKLAQDATYKGEPGAILGAPKRAGRAIAEQIPSEKAQKVLGAAGSFLMPIYNTIARIHEEGLKIAPGVGMLPLDQIGLGPKGGARPLDRKLAQQAVGLAFGASALGYAASGGIRGPGPSNSNEAQAMRDQGYTPNTTNVAGYWVPNSWFGEYGPYLNEIGAINDARLYDHGDKGWDDLTWEKKAESVIKNSARAARDYPALDAVSTLTGFFTDPVKTIASFTGEVAAQYVPGPIRTKALFDDPKTRARTRGDDVPFEQQAEEAFRQRSGIGRETLPAGQDILGRDVPNRRQGWAALAPNVGQDRPDPIIQAYLDADLNIGDPPKQLTVPGLTDAALKPELSPEEARRWNTLRGEGIIRRVSPAVADPAFAAATPDARQKYLDRQRLEAAEEAHARLRAEIGTAEINRRITEAQRRKAG